MDESRGLAIVYPKVYARNLGMAAVIRHQAPEVPRTKAYEEDSRASQVIFDGFGGPDFTSIGFN